MGTHDRNICSSGRPPDENPLNKMADLLKEIQQMDPIALEVWALTPEKRIRRHCYLVETLVDGQELTKSQQIELDLLRALNSLDKDADS